MNDRFRVSDADRDRVAGQLRDHYAAGRLTADELDERLTTALNATTEGELRQVLTDLPGAGPVSPSGIWLPPRPGQAWTVARRRRPRITPVFLLALLAVLVIPGAGYVALALLQVVALVWLVALLAGAFIAARFWRRVRREWMSGPGGPGRHGPGWGDGPGWPGPRQHRHQFGSGWPS